MNQLQNQVSPYLLQHKDNPVHWLPWGDEALQMAKQLDKPIILSIGYAACHWCHVMEHESFEDLEVARLMNNHYICIKVDREERPDIDLIYMDAIHQMGLAGGWPLHVFLMPDQKPFYGGTYFPKPNWLQLLSSIQSAYASHKSELQASADGFASNLSASSTGFYPLDLDTLTPILPDVLDQIRKNLDPVFGGVHKAPKFPLPVIGLFFESLPEKLASDFEIFQHSDKQLTRMAQGGIFDQIGGGFSRYSVDSEWFCPHFEKMLYDNAQLLHVYAKAFVRTKNMLYYEVITSTIDYLVTEMKDTSGLYFASLDADSEGIEGKYYVWTYTELIKILPYENYAPFYQDFHIKPNGNWEDGANILFKNKPVLNAVYSKEIDLLKKARTGRIRPQTDTKLLLCWNALLGKGLLQAGLATKDSNVLQLAIDLGEKLELFFENESNHLLHQINFSGKPIYAFLDDSVAYGLFLVDLYLYTADEKYVRRIEILLNEILVNYESQQSLLSFQSSLNDALISNNYEVTDSVLPASNSMLCELFLWAGILLNDTAHTLRAKEMMAGVLEQAQVNPLYHANWLRIYATWYESPVAIIKVNTSKISWKELPKLNAIWVPTSNQKETFLVCIGSHCLRPCEDLPTLFEQLATI
jgi:uncharacterized protein YyaL (SSP411 family)